MEIPKKGFTHGTKFHSDDVFSTAFLRILNPDIEIQRGLEVPQDFDGIVYDIGRGEFDHHQADKEYRENGCPYAAFGLLWRAFGTRIFSEEDALRFDEKFIQPLDLSDNTGCECVLATVIDEFNPGWDSDESYDEQFWKAVQLAQTILENHFRAIAGINRAKAVVEEQMKASDGEILLLETFAPWKSQVIGSTYRFVVYPSNRGGYSIQGVPVSKEDNTLVCPFPKEWWGKTAQELQQASGIASIRFCHPNGFLAATETKEDAIAAAKYAIESQEYKALGDK